MNSDFFFDKILPKISKWWFSVFIFVPSWILAEQFWMALARNILMAVRYPYPPLMGILFFLMDNITLILHEGGHTIFGIFGWRFLTILGGTLMQILIPFLVFVSAWWKKQKVLAQFSLFWLGYAWVDTAAYCADAMFQDLPLIGNLPKSAHDFTNMLTMTGLLDSYRTVAWIIYVIGVLILILGILWPLFQRKESVDLDEQQLALKRALSKQLY